MHAHVTNLLEAIGTFEEQNLMASEDLRTNLDLCKQIMQSKSKTNERVEWLRRVLKASESERVEANKMLEGIEREYQALQLPTAMRRY